MREQERLGGHLLRVNHLPLQRGPKICMVDLKTDL